MKNLKESKRSKKRIDALKVEKHIEIMYILLFKHKRFKVKNRISEKNIIEEKPEVIGFVETMLNGKYKVVMECYTLCKGDRNEDGRVVLIAIKEVLKGIMVEESNNKRKEESIWLGLTNNKTRI